MSNRQLTIAGCIIAVIVTAVLIYSTRQDLAATVASGQSPSIRFRNSLCRNSDRWYNVHMYEHDGSRPAQAGAILKDQNLYVSYNARLERNGDVTVTIHVNNWNTGAKVIFPEPATGQTPRFPDDLPDFLKERAIEFAGKFLRAANDIYVEKSGQ